MSSGAGDRAQPTGKSNTTAAVMNAARRIAITPGGSRSRALRLYRATDLLRRGKDDGRPIALHARWQQHRLASGRPHRARVCLEAQVELPEGNGPAVLGGHVVAVAAVADCLHTTLWAQCLEVGTRGRHHPAACRCRRSLAGGDCLQVRDEVGARSRVLQSGERHEVARDDGLRVLEPAVERRRVPDDGGVLERLGVAREPLGGPGAPSPHAREAGAREVDAWLHRVTGDTLPEHRGPAARVALQRRSRDGRDRAERCACQEDENDYAGNPHCVLPSRRDSAARSRRNREPVDGPGGQTAHRAPPSEAVGVAVPLGPRRPCYSKRAMNRWRAVVAVIAVAVWALSAPLAMASNNCTAMGAMCEGPCGVASCATSNVPVSNILLAVASVSPRPPESFPCALLALPDPPPRATLLFA